MKVGLIYYYYIHRAGKVYEIVYSDKDIDISKESSVIVNTLRGSTISTSTYDLYHRLEDIRSKLNNWMPSGESLVANSEFKTIEEYISHIRGNKLNDIGI